jgi:hypothetical protein
MTFLQAISDLSSGKWNDADPEQQNYAVPAPDSYQKSLVQYYIAAILTVLA